MRAGTAPVKGPTGDRLRGDGSLVALNVARVPGRRRADGIVCSSLASAGVNGRRNYGATHARGPASGDLGSGPPRRAAAGKTGPFGKGCEWTFDRVITVTSPGGRAIVFTYVADHVSAVAGPSGPIATYVYETTC